MKRPNIIVYFSDQQRRDIAAKCYGQPLLVSPNLDRRQSEGVKFEKCSLASRFGGPAFLLPAERKICDTGKLP